MTHFTSVEAAMTDKGGEHFNVAAYGAVGNGSTDDTLAIQAALDAAAPTEGTVYFPRGTYIVSASSLEPAAGVKMLGESWGASLKLADSQTIPVVLVSGADGVVIENLDIDGNKSNQSVSDNIRMGIDIDTSEDVAVRGCRIHDTGHTGLYARHGVTNLGISNNSFVSCGQETGSIYPCIYIVGIDGYSKSIRVENNHFSDSRMGISMRSGGGTLGNDIALFGHTISGNTFLDIGQVMAYAHCSELVISNNTIVNDAATRPPTSYAFSSQGYTNQITINSNAIYWNTTSYVAFEVVNAASRVTVSGNIIRGGVYGINVSGSGTEHIKIIDNTVQDTLSVGIFVNDSVAHAQVISNDLINTVGGTKCWIQVTTDVDDIVVCNNRLYSAGATGTGIAFDATVTGVTFGSNRVSGFAAKDNAIAIIPSAELTMIDSDIQITGTVDASGFKTDGAAGITQAVTVADTTTITVAGGIITGVA